MDKDVKRVFTVRSIVSFRGALKLNNYLVRETRYPLERTVDSFKYKSKRCQVCNTPLKLIYLLVVISKETLDKS